MKRGMTLKLLLLLLFTLTLAAADNNVTSDVREWSVRVGYGYSDESDLGEIISMMGDQHPAGTSAGGVELGYLFSQDSWGLPLDFYLKGGLNRFFENGHQPDFMEVTFYIKAYWNFRPWERTIRLGFGEGASYAWGIPYVEKLEAQAEGDHNSRFLNYLDISLDFDLGRMVGYRPLYDTYAGYALKHRSGIYGAINGVRRGGSNYNLWYVEHNF
jgi:outer membrane protein